MGATSERTTSLSGPTFLDQHAAADPAAVLADVCTMIAEVIGEEYVSEADISVDTAFYADLEIESIEFIALGEALQARYGDHIDFPAWIATMEVDDIIAMRVGQLVDHIVASLA
jgi:acyl carrier protein